jgi:hypothetical protein
VQRIWHRCWAQVNGQLFRPAYRQTSSHGRIIFDAPGTRSLEIDGSALDLKVGDKVELWVRDANGTINLYDKFYAMRDDIVEAVWEIPGRGLAT